MSEVSQARPESKRRRAAIVLGIVCVAAVAIVLALARGGDGRPTQKFVAPSVPGGFGFGGSSQIIVTFAPDVTDAAAKSFVQEHAMTCGDRGCNFVGPFGGSSFNYPDRAVALKIEAPASEDDAKKAAIAIRDAPGVASVQLYNKAGVAIPL